MKVSKKLMTFKFIWYDLWVGAYWNVDKRCLYVCPFPTLCFCFYLPPRMTRQDRILNTLIVNADQMTDGQINQAIVFLNDIIRYRRESPDRQAVQQP